MHLTHTATKALEAIMTMMISLGFSAREERVVTKLLRQVLHVLIVVEVGLLLLVLVNFRIVAARSVIMRLLWREIGVSIEELSTWAQSRKVVALDVFHLQVGAGSVRWEKSTHVLLLLSVLLVEDEHLEHVLSVDQLVFELLSPQEFRLQE